VKALALAGSREVGLEPFGVRENRRFYLADADGRLVSGPNHGRLMRVRASYDAASERLDLRFPDGTAVQGAAGAVDGDRVTSDFFGRPVSGREVTGPFSRALSAWYGSPLRLIRTDRPGDASDVWPVSLMSRASAEDMAAKASSDRPRETRRFRMLVELDGCEPYEEDTWIGGLVRVGEALLRIPGPIPRCAVTTYDPDSGVRDFGTLRAIRDQRGRGPGGKLYFGVYGEVVEPGIVRVGDRADPDDRGTLPESGMSRPAAPNG
jgi:uncharacterized protein YcbX